MMDKKTLQMWKQISRHLYSFYIAFVADRFEKTIPAKHIQILSEYVEDLHRKNTKNRLCVAMPPQHSKSSLITIAYTCWLICHNPNIRILVINAEKELSTSFGIQIRNLLFNLEPFLPFRVSKVKGSSTHLMFETKDGKLLNGEIRLTGAGGSITGHPADVVIVDDPYKGREEEFTPTQIEKKWTWWTVLVEQRLRTDGKLILLHTRWHSEDIQGRIKADAYESQKYNFVEFKAINDNNQPLWPEYYDLEFYQDKERTLKERKYQAIYQQTPLDLTSDFFYTDHLHWDDTYLEQYNIANCRSYDMAYTSEQEAIDKGIDADFTAGLHAEKISDNHYIFSDWLYKRLGKQNIRYVQKQARFDGKIKPILIEPGPKGGAARELFNLWDSDYLAEYNCIQSEPIGTKADRATALANAIYDGKIHIYCTDNSIRKELKQQLESFPNGTHDDLIDAMAYAYNYLKDKTDSSNIYRTGNNKLQRRTSRWD